MGVRKNFGGGALVIAAVLLFAGGIFNAVMSWRDASVAPRERQMIALVGVHGGGDPENTYYTYSFVVDGTTYTGSFDLLDAASAGRLAAGSPAGQHVIVYFDPDNLTRNSQTEFRAKSEGDLRRAALCIVLAVFLFGLDIWIAAIIVRKNVAAAVIDTNTGASGDEPGVISR
jgi:hypothetical protein